MQLPPMGSQRCWVAGVTPMSAMSTGALAAFGGGTDDVVVALVFFDDPELLHPALAATRRDAQSAATMSRDFADIVFPRSDGAERSTVPSAHAKGRARARARLRGV